MGQNEHQDRLERCADCNTAHITSSACPDPSQTVFELFLKNEEKESVAPPDDITNSRRTTIILSVAIRPQEKIPEKFQSPLITSQL